MALKLGDTAPDFEANSTDGPIRSHEWTGDQEGWGADIYETQGHAPNYPIIADDDFNVSPKPYIRIVPQPRDREPASS